MIIDIHVHIGPGPDDPTKRELIAACERYGVDKAYIAYTGIAPVNVFSPDEGEIEASNIESYRFMAQHPDMIGSFCYINPRNKNSMDELKKGVEDYGMSGMKLWVAVLCDDPMTYPLVEKCIEYNAPILVHAFYNAETQVENESRGVHVSNLARRYPEAKLIMAHLGSNCYDGVKSIRNCPNVSVDFSGTIYRRDDLDYTKKQIGAGRILFGSDIPGSFTMSLGQIEEADFTPEEKALVYGGNALRLLDRENRGHCC